MFSPIIWDEFTSLNEQSVMQDLFGDWPEEDLTMDSDPGIVLPSWGDDDDDANHAVPLDDIQPMGEIDFMVDHDPDIVVISDDAARSKPDGFSLEVLEADLEDETIKLNTQPPVCSKDLQTPSKYITNLPNHFCDKCDRKFKRLGNMKNHYRMCDGSTTTRKRRRHACPKCPVTRSSKAGLRQHITSVHEELDRITPSQNCRTFTQADNTSPVEGIYTLTDDVIEDDIYPGIFWGPSLNLDELVDL